MPLHISVPLGPLRYTKKIDGRGTASFGYLILWAWWWVPTKYLIIGAVRLCRALYRRAWRPAR